jgi:hypothetical protein
LAPYKSFSAIGLGDAHALFWTNDIPLTQAFFVQVNNALLGRPCPPGSAALAQFLCLKGKLPMFLTPLLSSLHPSRPHRGALKRPAQERRPTRRLVVERFEERVVPAAPANYTNLDLTGNVVVTGPVHDVRIKFDPNSPGSLTIQGDAHDVAVVGDIPAGDTLTLQGNVHDIKAGNVAGQIFLNGNGNDVTMKGIAGDVELGAAASSPSNVVQSVHDVRAGNITGALDVNGNAHDVTTKNIAEFAELGLGNGPPSSVHDVKTGNIAGLFFLAANAHDITTGDIATDGRVTLRNLHDFKTGNVAGRLWVFGSFHDGNVGTISGGGTKKPGVLLTADFHKFQTESTAGQGFSGVEDITGDGGFLVVEGGPAAESKVKFEG